MTAIIINKQINAAIRFIAIAPLRWDKEKNQASSCRL
jgi:hypothetical protein